MRAAGYKGPDVFAPRAIALITRAASGLTRRINILADKALLAAFTEDTHGVGERQVRAAIRDSEFARLGARPGRYGRFAGWSVAAAALLALGGYAWLVSGVGEAPVPIAASTPASTTSPSIPSPPVSPAPAGPAAVATETPTPAAVDPAPEPKPAAPMLSAEAAKRVAGYFPAGSPLLRERLAATRARLDTEPDAHLSLELFLTENSDPARAERFLQRARDLVDLAELYVIPIADGRKYRLRVTYGAFPDRDAANDAARRLPPKYRQAFQPEPRDFNELRNGL
jgi:septal ring-binding cell division protein DamX